MFLVEYLDHLAQEPLPPPLNGPSLARGTRRDLKKILSRMDPIDQECLKNRLAGRTQRSLAEGGCRIRTQAGISYRTAQAIRVARHLALEPSDVEETLRELLALTARYEKLVPEAVARWARGTGTYYSAHYDLTGEHEHGYACSFRLVSRRASPSLRKWLVWRWAMPKRTYRDLPHLRWAMISPEEARGRLSVLPRCTARTAASILGVSHESVEMWRRRSGLPESHWVPDPLRDERAQRRYRPGSPLARLLAGECSHLGLERTARVLGVSSSTVARWRREHRIQSSCFPRSRAERVRAISEAPGRDARTKAAAIGIAYSTAWRWMREACLLGFPLWNT